MKRKWIWTRCVMDAAGSVDEAESAGFWYEGEVAECKGGGGTQTVQQTADPWPGQQPYILDVLSQGQQQYYSDVPQYFPESTLAPIDPASLEAQQYALDYAHGIGAQMAGIGATGVNNLITRAGDVENDPFFQGAVNASIRPAVQQFMDVGGPLAQIRSGATAAGQYGSTRQGVAEGIALSRLNQQTLDTTSRMGEEAYGRGLEAQARGLALLPSTQQAALQPAGILSMVGEDIRGQEQDFLNEAINRWNFEQALPEAKLTQYRNIVQGGYGGESTSTSPAPKSNRLLTGLGGAATGAAAGAALGFAGGGPIGAGIGLLIGLLG